MDKLQRMRMRDLNDDDIFSIYTEYVKGEITKDLNNIYEKETHLVDSEEPWVFRLDKDN